MLPLSHRTRTHWGYMNIGLDNAINLSVAITLSSQLYCNLKLRLHKETFSQLLPHVSYDVQISRLNEFILCERKSKSNTADKRRLDER